MRTYDIREYIFGNMSTSDIYIYIYIINIIIHGVTLEGGTLTLYHCPPTVYGSYRAYGTIFREQTSTGYSTNLCPMQGMCG